MVLATKKAVGSEYGYSTSARAYQQQEPKVRVRVKRRTSPLAGICLIAVLFLTGLSYTYLKACKAHLIWQVQQTKQTNLAMQIENEKLKLEVAKLKSLDRVEKIAETKLAMVKNPGVEYLAMQDKGTAVTAPVSGQITTLPVKGESNPQIAGNQTQGGKLLERVAAVLTSGHKDKG